jgi:hypothetical protein
MVLIAHRHYHQHQDGLQRWNPLEFVADMTQKVCVMVWVDRAKPISVEETDFGCVRDDDLV